MADIDDASDADLARLARSKIEQVNDPSVKEAFQLLQAQIESQQVKPAAAPAAKSETNTPINGLFRSLWIS